MQVVEPKPSNYQYSQQNFIDLPDEHLTQNDFQNLLNYNGLYQDYINHRQLENDLILKEAQEKLQNKLNIQQQQQQTAYDLHQLVQQEKLRIVVPDEDQEVTRKGSFEMYSLTNIFPGSIKDDQTLTAMKHTRMNMPKMNQSPMRVALKLPMKKLRSPNPLKNSHSI